MHSLDHTADAPDGTAPRSRRATRLPLVVGGIVMALAFWLAWSQGGLVSGRAATGYNPLYSAAGGLVGILVGLTGVGGGSLMTPLLVLLFRFHPVTAVATDLLYASITKSVGTLVHGANETVNWGIVGRLAIGSIPATSLTVLLLYLFHLNGEAAGRLISAVLGVMLMVTAVTILFRRRLLALVDRHTKPPEPATIARLTILLGAVLGVLITLSSVGAGAIGVTVLVFLYPRKPMSQLVGSDIAHAVPLTLIAGLGHFALGGVNLALLGSLLVGSVPGIILGSHLTRRIPERALQPILAATLAVAGAKLVF